MRKIITFLFLLGLTVAHAQELPGKMIKDIVFKPEKELTKLYGKPSKKVHHPNDKGGSVDDLIGSYSLSWSNKDKYINVAYTDATFKTPKSILVSGYKFNPNTFHLVLGWDKPVQSRKGNQLIFTNLKGLKADYDYEYKSFFIVLDDPDIKTFGKKK